MYFGSRNSYLKELSSSAQWFARYGHIFSSMGRNFLLIIFDELDNSASFSNFINDERGTNSHVTCLIWFGSTYRWQVFPHFFSLPYLGNCWPGHFNSFKFELLGLKYIRNQPDILFLNSEPPLASYSVTKNEA
jgi:hypothetical protein